MIKAVKVIVTRFVNDSLKNMIVPSMIMAPWKTDFQNQIKNVLVDKDLPFWSVA